MDFLLLAKAAVQGVVEGVTEFLPISSTGHLILSGQLIGFNDEKAKVFDIAIQTGAIFAVILVYWQKLFSTAKTLTSSQASRRLVLNIFLAFLPAVIMGLLFGKAIKAHLFTANIVATAFIVGGFIILWAEKLQTKNELLPEGRYLSDLESIRPMLAIQLGLVQCLAMIPGTSRSGATIIGGMFLGLKRTLATEFSFFLAIPTLIGAGAYSLYKERALLSMADMPLFGVGLVTAFISAWLCIRWLLRYVAHHSFVGFAYYRIAFGILILLTSYMNWINWSA